MFWLITTPMSWLTSVPKSIAQVDFFSAYTIQNIAVTFSFIQKFKLGSIRNTLKFFFTHEKLPKHFRDFNRPYKYTRESIIKTSGFLKSFVFSKKSASVLAAVPSAALLATGGFSVPIILLGAGFAAYSTYSGEVRRESLALKTQDLRSALKRSQMLKALQTTYNYKTLPAKIKSNDRDKSFRYIPPNILEITKIGFDLTLAGVACSTSSFCFMCTGCTAAYTLVSEIVNYRKFKSMKRKLTFTESNKLRLNSRHKTI